MKGTVRQRVLDFIARRPGASAAQIGGALKLSPATVRHHLRILRNDGRIVSSGLARAGSRGRPSESYRLSQRMLGDNLGLIADSLLRAWPREGADPASADMIRALADALIRELGPAGDNGSRARRLGRLVDALDAAHYHARWEAGAEGPRIILGHCPYAVIIQDHPELCQMDQAALGRYMRADVTQLAKIDIRGHSVSHCVFAVRQADSGSVRN